VFAVWYRGIPYTLDLVRCRRALVQQQVEGELDSMESLANAVDMSRSTASRFFSGRPTSLTVTLKLLDALHLKFGEVATSVVEDTTEPRDNQDDAAGPSAGVGAKLAPGPRNSDGRGGLAGSLAESVG
jgi:transcriptional regulator with XRE-family HTH domain